MRYDALKIASRVASDLRGGFSIALLRSPTWLVEVKLELKNTARGRSNEYGTFDDSNFLPLIVTVTLPGV